uniref:Uncharacterized protein n=1 Tax=Schistocephalus solidus TaxID=70667 RepID=A0A0X3PM81_SCHSO
MLCLRHWSPRAAHVPSASSPSPPFPRLRPSVGARGEVIHHVARWRQLWARAVIGSRRCAGACPNAHLLSAGLSLSACVRVDGQVCASAWPRKGNMMKAKHAGLCARRSRGGRDVHRMLHSMVVQGR